MEAEQYFSLDKLTALSTCAGFNFLPLTMNFKSICVKTAGRVCILILTTLIVSTAVSVSGVIMFVGLVVPHLLRLLIGSDHRHLLPLSMLFGASLLLLADIFSRLVVAPAELPIGLLMTFIGGPFFIVLLLQQRKQLSLG